MNNKKYFDHKVYNQLILKYQLLYKNIENLNDKEVKTFEIINKKLDLKLYEMAQKIIKRKGYYKNKPADLYDAVHEAWIMVKGALNKGKFNPNKGNSFSYCTSIIDRFAKIYYFIISRDIPLSQFEEISIIPDENDVNIYEYMKKLYYDVVMSEDKKEELNIFKNKKIKIEEKINKPTLKKALALNKLVRISDPPFEESYEYNIKHIKFYKKIESLIFYYQSLANAEKKNNKNIYSKLTFKYLMLEKFIDILKKEKNIDNLTLRKIKKKLVADIIEKGKKLNLVINNKSLNIMVKKEYIKELNKYYEELKIKLLEFDEIRKLLFDDK